MYNVISALNRNSSFVCFRESKLTRILQPYLGGNSLTAIICAVSPVQSNYQESINTLRFALCAGGIKNDVKINVVEEKPDCILPGPEQLEQEIKESQQTKQILLKEVEDFKRLVEEADAEFEVKSKDLQLLYETYQETINLHKEINALKKDKLIAYEQGKVAVKE
jgi:hypothetical protein